MTPPQDQNRSDHDLLVELVTLVRPLVGKVDEIEKRIGALERFRAELRGRTAGALAVAGALGGGVGAVARAIGH